MKKIARNENVSRAVGGLIPTQPADLGLCPFWKSVPSSPWPSLPL